MSIECVRSTPQQMDCELARSSLSLHGTLLSMQKALLDQIYEGQIGVEASLSRSSVESQVTAE